MLPCRSSCDQTFLLNSCLVGGNQEAGDCTSERALSALNISMATRTDRESVDALAFPSWKNPHGSSNVMSLPPAVYGDAYTAHLMRSGQTCETILLCIDQPSPRASSGPESLLLAPCLHHDIQPVAVETDI